MNRLGYYYRGILLGALGATVVLALLTVEVDLRRAAAGIAALGSFGVAFFATRVGAIEDDGGER